MTSIATPDTNPDMSSDATPDMSPDIYQDMSSDDGITFINVTFYNLLLLLTQLDSYDIMINYFVAALK